MCDTTRDQETGAVKITYTCDIDETQLKVISTEDGSFLDHVPTNTIRTVSKTHRRYFLAVASINSLEFSQVPAVPPNGSSELDHPHLQVR